MHQNLSGKQQKSEQQSSSAFSNVPKGRINRKERKVYKAGKMHNKKYKEKSHSMLNVENHKQKKAKKVK